jgi:XTP/dITP diphosphohydrolase
VAQANWFGEIVDEPQGGHGFGYDPHFYLPDQGCTAAELAPSLKNKISHRAQALMDLTSQLTGLGLLSSAAAHTRAKCL